MRLFESSFEETVVRKRERMSYPNKHPLVEITVVVSPVSFLFMRLLATVSLLLLIGLVALPTSISLLLLISLGRLCRPRSRFPRLCGLP